MPDCFQPPRDIHPETILQSPSLHIILATDIFWRLIKADKVDMFEYTLQCPGLKGILQYFRLRHITVRCW